MTESLEIATRTSALKLPWLEGWPRLGIYQRFMLRHYAWHIQIVFLAIVTVATAINISPEIGGIWRDARAAGLWAGLSQSAFYVACRLMDNGSQVFPVAFVLGIAWAEIAHVLSGQHMLARTAGAPFSRRATALFAIAALSVPLQFAFDNIVRPLAYMGLSLNGLGEYGKLYQRDRSESEFWLSFGPDVLQVRLRDDPRPRMDRLTLYEFSREGRLVRLTEAETVQRKEGGSEAEWQMRDATVWDLAQTDTAETGDAGATAFSRHPLLDLKTPISGLWLDYREVAARYIPLLDLARLAGSGGLPDHAPDYAAWLQIRLAQSFIPGLIGICIGAVFLIVLDRKGLLAASLTALFCGYAGFTMTRVSAVITEWSSFPPILAAWSLPLLLGVAACGFLAFIRRSDRRYEA